MLWMQGLLMEGAVSITKFCNSLEARCSKHQKAYLNYPVKDIYKLLIASTADEFRNFWYCTQTLNNICKEVDDGTECPACYQLPSVIYSFDADFQLVRKASSGRQWKPPKHQDCLFLNQEKVDTLMSNYGADSRKLEMVCNDFQAGNSLRSKNKNKKLSEKAVFGSACRHEVPKYFFSLKHGERLGYAVYLLKMLIEDTEKENVHIMYDIACSLHRHLKILYGPRRTEGIPLTDGECMERIWSYLGRFSSITKEMTPENRIDLLTDALLYYGQKMKSKLGATLPQKMSRAIDVEKNSRNSLQELLKPFPDISNITLNDWCQKEHTNSFRGLSKEKDSSILSLKEQYSLALEELENKRSGLSSVEGDAKVIPSNHVQKRLQVQVKKLSKEAHVTWNTKSPEHQRELSLARDKIRHQVLENIQQNIAERVFLIDLMKKYARGQAVASRLGQQLKKINEKIREKITEYNSIGGTPSVLPAYIEFEQVKSCENEIWDFIKPSNRATDTVPLSIKQQATRLFCLEKRAGEEQKILKSEMNATLQWYMSKYYNILNSISDYTKAEKSALVKEGLNIETTFNYLLVTFQPYVEDPTLKALNKFASMVGLPEVSFLDTCTSITTNYEDLLECEEDIVDTLSEFEDSDEEFSDSDLIDALNYIPNLK